MFRAIGGLSPNEGADVREGGLCKAFNAFVSFLKVSIKPSLSRTSNKHETKNKLG